MEVVCNPIHHNSMSRIVSPGTPCADICFTTEDIDKFPLTLITELAAQNNGSHGCGSCRCWRFFFCLVTWSGGWVRKEGREGETERLSKKRLDLGAFRGGATREGGKVGFGSSCTSGMKKNTGWRGRSLASA